MMRALVATLLIASAALAPGCGEEDLTEILVAVDTDLDVPEEIDAIRIDVIGPAGELKRAEGALRSESELPETLGLVHREGPLGPVRINVTGRLSGEDVIHRHAEVDFVEGEVRVLRLWLRRACVGLACPEDRTCVVRGAEASCQTRRVPPSDLEPWEGQVQRTDAGPPPGDAGMDACTPALEECNGADDDCDGEVDEAFDLDRDPRHCGECGNACPENPPNAAGVCIAGSCMLVCDEFWDDCDGEVEGCESPLSAAATCGDCDTSCDSSAPFCAGAVGGEFECVATCSAEQTECGASCVDTDSSPLHCGECDRECPSPPHATPACAEGECGFLCDDGWAECDGMDGNGCEARTASDPMRCGDCDTVCESGNCVDGFCVPVDGGTDAGLDAGPADAGTGLDAGAPDGGTDAA